MIIRGVEYLIEPNSNGRRVTEKDLLLNQRDWVAVRIPIDFNYSNFSSWFEKNCTGYWRYPVARTFWFSESQDVIRYSFDYYDSVNLTKEL